VPKVAVVTDSTATVAPQVLEAHGITVVPLQVVIGPGSFEDGVDEGAGPDRVAAALRDRLPVSTSRPSPGAVLELYQEAAERGAAAIVSVHLSGELSATVESALLAAKRAPIPVHVVDTRQVAAGTGYAALRAAEVAAAGGTAEEAAAAALARAQATSGLFYVDTLDHLRRSGRLRAAAALVGTALAVKPLLQVEDGRISLLEKVRTSGKALARLEELAIQAAGEGPVEVTVCHLANPAQAETLAAALTSRLGEQLAGRAVVTIEVGAVIGAHVGPGLVGVTVAPG
jgi:DegV family protein with EDD domain